MEALVEHTPEEQEQYNYSRTLSHSLGYSPDEDVLVVRSPGIDWDDPGTVMTDTEMTDAMTGFTLDSPAGNREVLYCQMGMNLGPCPGTFPNLQTQMELDKLRRNDGRSRCTYSDMWLDASLYQSQKDAMAKSVQQHQSHPTDTHSEKPHKWDRSGRETVDRAKCRSQSHGQEEDADPPVQGAKGGGTPPPEQEPDIEVISSGGDWHHVIATLNWMAGPDADFPAHLSIDKPLAF